MPPTYDMPICKEHIKSIKAALFKFEIAVIISLVLAFISGVAFCKMIGG